MATIWDILGLDGPTDDLKAIKSAYARKLKVTRPEDDPNGFMQLRDAHDRALGYAHNDLAKFAPNEAVVNNIQQTEILGSNIETTSEHDFSDQLEAEANGFNYEQLVEIITRDREAEHKQKFEHRDRMRQRIIQVLDSPWNSTSLKAWSELFDHPDLETIDAESDFTELLKHTLLEYFGFFDSDPKKHNRNKKSPVITKEVGEYIFWRTGWNRNQFEFYDVFFDTDIIFLAKDFGLGPEMHGDEEFINVATLSENEKTSLFYQRLGFCLCFLAAGFGILLFQGMNFSVFLTVLAGALIFRGIQMWYILVRDHWN